jgi:hypothetical protein
MPPLSEILLVLLRLAITTGACVAVVGTASVVIWSFRRRSPARYHHDAHGEHHDAGEGKDKFDKGPKHDYLDEDHHDDQGPDCDAPADGFEKGHNDDHGRFDPIQWELQAIRYRLDELSRGIGRLKESLPTYMLKNIAWAVVGATVSIMLEQALSASEQPYFGRPHFVDFTDQP